MVGSQWEASSLCCPLVLRQWIVCEDVARFRFVPVVFSKVLFVFVCWLTSSLGFLLVSFNCFYGLHEMSTFHLQGAECSTEDWS